MNDFNTKKVCTNCFNYLTCSPDLIVLSVRDGRCSRFKKYDDRLEELRKKLKQEK